MTTPPNGNTRRILNVISLEHAIAVGLVIGAVWLMLGGLEKQMEVNTAVTNARLTYLETSVRDLEGKVDRLRVSRNP
jgi:hypothetical protein